MSKELEEFTNQLWDEIPYYTEEELVEIEYFNDIEDVIYDWMGEIEEQLEFESSLDDEFMPAEPPIWEVWNDDDIRSEN